ncbi:hypothetical protein GMDG_02748 [Pseudogymnoascus destructans 20631-21]|uniref:Uncharacterized protein n=1 Tax=Pseudogymnoascus destructans (strain ATCC MYA-4855 / 20631-21) TaxID=658429 RepID=L8G784_PSED2|nr:hypothetical protein GMDG_02748 [Pseudogymnoascus destructans 20631-21]
MSTESDISCIVPEVRAHILRLDSAVTVMPPAGTSHNLSFTTAPGPVGGLKSSTRYLQAKELYTVCRAWRFDNFTPRRLCIHLRRRSNTLLTLPLSISTSGRPEREMHARFIAEKKTTPAVFHSLTL